LVAYAWGGKHLGPGDEIVITHLEHHANIVPWQLLSQKTGAVLKVAPVDEAGNLLLSEFEDLLGPKTKLVAATHVSNALGTVTPVEKIVQLGHRYGARVLIDGAQSIPHLPVDVAELGVDFFAFSGHKIYGPTGIGVLYGSEEALAETPPWQGGGNMIADVTLERSLYQGLPNKFEAGTGNIADAVGLGEALRYVERLGIERLAAYEHALLDYATPRLADIPGVRLVGWPATSRSRSARPSTPRGLRCAPAITARSRFCADTAWKRRFARRSPSTTRSRRLTSSSTRCAGSRKAEQTSAERQGRLALFP
jgi:cysteine desulfurase/selenocysteine lyase